MEEKLLEKLVSEKKDLQQSLKKKRQKIKKLKRELDDACKNTQSFESQLECRRKKRWKDFWSGFMLSGAAVASIQSTQQKNQKKEREQLQQLLEFWQSSIIQDLQLKNMGWNVAYNDLLQTNMQLKKSENSVQWKSFGLGLFAGGLAVGGGMLLYYNPQILQKTSL